MMLWPEPTTTRVASSSATAGSFKICPQHAGVELEHKPLILETAGLSTADIALTEIVEGKMKWETDLPKPKRKSRRRVRKA